MAGFSILQEAAIPFNGNGSFSLAEPAFVPLTTISSTAMNSDLTDIASGLSQCLTTDGQSTMTAQIKGYAGNVITPGYGFAVDPNTGWYRIGPNNFGATCNGAKVLDISENGLDVIGAVSQNGIVLLPPGLGPLPWAGSTAPAGWLLCYGQSLLRDDYADLFAAIGTTYGAVDGTHFSLPDMRGRLAAGRDDMGSSAAGRLTSTTMTPDGITLGATGGAQTVTIAQGNLPAVTLTTTIAAGQGSHVHSLPGTNNATTGSASSVAKAATAAGENFDSAAATLPEMTGTTPLGGSGTGLNKVQPTLITNYIIFAGV